MPISRYRDRIPAHLIFTGYTGTKPRIANRFDTRNEGKREGQGMHRLFASPDSPLFCSPR